ncbi:hypothetical protein LAG90_00485 [Marinilongibacter aquaticus]|uniref:hypothetical protein n=1 Tax=Marinilongibacter aquaticus TaxID=2975157 RepID=UPI0021BDAADC|nr:hypothetical protein [Marinilongibacter aquaticus]UBM59135.1 hypothetical protein LAG90_00485 [Marinilongibacter aquaticus]
MITLNFSLITLGFYLFYYTSKRLRFARLNRLQNWAAQNVSMAKLVGALLLLAAVVLSCVHLGVAVGCFFFVVTLMTVASLEVLLLPLNLLQWPYVLPLTLFVFLIETFL